MTRIKRLRLYCSTGNVSYNEPHDRIKLYSGSDEIVNTRRLRPPIRRHTIVSAYDVDIDYLTFLEHPVRLELEGSGIWGTQDLFLVGELQYDGYARWLPLAHCLGNTQASRGKNECQLQHLTEAERHHPLQDLVVMMSVALPKHGSPQTRLLPSSGTVEMSVFVGEDSAPAILYQTLRNVSFDGSNAAPRIWFFHCPVRGGLPFTAEALSGVQFSVDFDSAWTDHDIQVFGINQATRRGRLLGRSAGADVRTVRQTAGSGAVCANDDLIPVAMTSVRPDASQLRPLSPQFTLRRNLNRDTSQSEHTEPTGARHCGR